MKSKSTSGASLKFSTPEIAVGLAAAKAGKAPKAQMPKKAAMPTKATMPAGKMKRMPKRTKNV